MKSRHAKYWIGILVLFAVLFVLLAVIGGIRNYSPVPFWDMWDGYLDFFVRARDGNVSAWWAQHNEHRILFSRVLFFLDLELFGGSIAFLIAANFVLAAIGFFIFYSLLRQMLPGEEQKCSRLVIAAVICTLTFSWVQNNNLTWGFQSQFIAAYLFPLGALYALGLSSSGGKHNNLLFTLAVLLGLASAGTMANGILALPLMVLIAVLMRMSWGRVSVLAFMTAIELYLYFSGYKSPGMHGSLTDALQSHPLELAQYVLLYLGGPVYYMTGEGSYFLAQAAGLFLIGSALFFTYKVLFASARQHPLQIVLLAFIVYVGGTAFGTAGGRVIFGTEQALSSRYMTPSLMAWSALLLLFTWYFRQQMNIPPRVVGALLLVPVLLLPAQLQALKNKDGELFDRMVAALALELGVRDERQIGHIFPDADWAAALAQKPVERNLSIFAHPQIRDAKECIGQSITVEPSVICRGSLDESSAVTGDPRFLKVRGWLFDPSSGRVPSKIWFADSRGNIMGYAITGQSRPDVAAAIDEEARYSGFEGYMLAGQATNEVSLIGREPDCLLSEVTVNAIPYYLAPWAENEMGQGTNSYLNVRHLLNHQWGSQGTFDRDTIPEFSIFGSYIAGDDDTGLLTIRAAKGAKVLYKTGPVASRQVVRLRDMDGTLLYEGRMPVTKAWGLLKFEAEWLPSTFLLEFIDEGNEWGEWSAIGLNNKASSNK